MRMGGRPGAPRALAVPTGPLGSAGPPQTAETIFSCILERLTENWLGCPGIGLAPVEPVFAGTVVGAGPPPPSDSSPGQAGPAGPTSEALGLVVVLE